MNKINKVKAFREAIGLTQKDLAKILDISVDSYSRKERGVSDFRKNEMLKITDIFKNNGIDESLQEIFFNI
ncbi:Helix-turn-helix domain protein [Streptococcus parauberis]|uniref:helix-turn-helix transcriptional regulator n=1 Tax=Streptococcus parauberis TaxID=1348 RepID=UPI000CCEDB27|nr:helix-turn-helix transcriptional regulator [Streptococcus parauberis]PNY20533.1 Helix-turn-helix domain protein [Streptococcus parauberis]